MAERPIIFSGPMVRALLDGRKTMTRRLATSPLRKCAIGDRLWVRESYSESDPMPAYKADNPNSDGWGWRPSIHMPRSASRITLEVTAVKIERLQDISPDDAWNEGVERRSRSVRQMWLFGADAIEREALYKRACVWEFEELWKSLHGPESWDANPEVIAISFAVERGAALKAAEPGDE